MYNSCSSELFCFCLFYYAIFTMRFCFESALGARPWQTNLLPPFSIHVSQLWVNIVVLFLMCSMLKMKALYCIFFWIVLSVLSLEQTINGKFVLYISWDTINCLYCTDHQWDIISCWLVFILFRPSARLCLSVLRYYSPRWGSGWNYFTRCSLKASMVATVCPAVRSVVRHIYLDFCFLLHHRIEFVFML